MVVIDPSGRPDAGALAASCRALTDLGFDVERRHYPDDAGPRLAARGVAARLALLEGALADGDVILCARGGYGMSDLLPQLDFEALAARAPSPVVGFSDISALLSALYARLGWPSLHAPMPGSPLWREEGDDVRAVREVLAAWPGSCAGSLPVRGDGEARGPLFGGCLSVLGAPGRHAVLPAQPGGARGVPRGRQRVRAARASPPQPVAAVGGARRCRGPWSWAVSSTTTPANARRWRRCRIAFASASAARCSSPIGSVTFPATCR
ncbi:MAG: LD-carboxypeptidase [Gammaproteobacteria bacterium]|nr:LD-carboxypeptidase [Gammaproteobacteria bacterium]